ncbi:MAG: YggS family pyridoxal phosphate-dependent enzyme [Nitrospinota bacterium]
MIADNLESVKHHIANAAKKAGRNPSTVRLIAVSKQMSSEKVLAAHQAGAKCFGENKIQEAVSKIDEVNLADVSWHFIGHLQKNKVKFLDSRFELIHSVDSLPLAEKISASCENQNRKQAVLLQVNVSGEEAKFGMTPSDLKDNLADFGKLKGLKVQGLMTIPPQDSDPENSRKYFSALRELRDECQALNVEGIELKELSMGMTSDYSIAIEEGATLVRVGTAIFGQRDAGPKL